ncbi:hypothetical protein M0R45_001351 [Rubus argutus]|uniref:Uncharacterized protein n=1 Tax=Rubus argutus TaxID=59490 RepID=A0AAW1VHB2_RUBAR
MVSNVVANSMVTTPCMLPRFPPVQLEELTVDVNTTPSDGTSQPGTPEKRVCRRPAMFSQGRASGESSRKSNKRPRNSANSNDQKVSVPSNPREVINGCYNPIYDNMGLPLDPHLRLLEASLKREFPSE